MNPRKPYRNFKKREPNLTIEQKVEQFIIRNSQNGYFTKVSTIPYKFGVSEDVAWSIVGVLLSSGDFESIHDEYTGEMKMCKFGKMYGILDLEKKRKRDKYRSSDKKQGGGGKTNTDQVAKNRGTNTDHVAKNRKPNTDQVAKNRGTNTDHVAKNRKPNTDQVAKNRGTNTDQVAKNRETNTDQVAKNSETNTDHVAKNRPKANN